jgi:hypothetical protein
VIWLGWMFARQWVPLGIIAQILILKLLLACAPDFARGTFRARMLGKRTLLEPLPTRVSKALRLAQPFLPFS